ncbi:MAG TPA: DUF4397 domain-containing protein, partial [Woeseiaceae bacterium]|nr:DUF4397 domain-containing protein [Woeseiaceae bacterium]
MTIVLRYALALAAAGLLLGGCAESTRPEATGKGNIRGINSVATGADVTFLIEERSLGGLPYKNATSVQEFDDLTYNFNFDAPVPGQSQLRRIATETVDVVPDTNYDFVLTGTVDAPSIVLWESAERQWEGSETEFEVSVGHVASGTGAVDVYFAARGSAPVAGSARGTLSFGERLPAFEVENGEYQLIVTDAGNPAAVLFTARSRDYTERTNVLFTIQDADPSITSSLSVRRIDQGGSVEVGDVNFPPTWRFFNSAFGSGNIDVYLDDDFATPIVGNLAHGSVSADVPVPVGDVTYTYTAAGNPGAILHEDEDTVAANTRSTNFVTGEAGDLGVVDIIDDRRPVSNFNKIRINQVAAGFATVDVYLVRSDIDIADVTRSLTLAANANSGYLRL